MGEGPFELAEACSLVTTAWNYHSCFQSPFPVLPTPGATLLLCYSSHKHPEPLASEEADLRFVLSPPCLTASQEIVEPKFVCPTHSEANQARTSEVGAEEGLLQSQARRMGGLCSKNPNS